MSTDPQRDKDDRPRGGAALAIGVFLVFVVAGPPLGGLAMLIAAILIALPGPVRMPALGFIFGGLGSMGLFLYLFGGLQAAVVGLVAAIAQYHGHARRVPLNPVLLASLVAGAVFLGIIALRTRGAPPVTVIALYLAFHAAAGIGCWLVANALLWPFRRRRAPVAA